MRIRALVWIGCLVGLGACRGDKLARIELAEPGSAEATFSSNGQRALVWADVDAKWSGPKNSRPELHYEIELFQGGASLGIVPCSTKEYGGTSVCGTDKNVAGTHEADCEYLLACTLPATQPGEVKVRVTGRPGPNVKVVTSMSVNLRAE